MVVFLTNHAAYKFLRRCLLGNFVIAVLQAISSKLSQKTKLRLKTYVLKYSVLDFNKKNLNMSYLKPKFPEHLQILLLIWDSYKIQRNHTS